MGLFSISPTQTEHIPGVVALQRACFPEPFPADLLWQPEHIASHIALFPQGQWVALCDGHVVASCTNMRISKADWQAHLPWENLTGGLALPNHNLAGEILYGIDISVHPEFRRQGLARLLYTERFNLVNALNLSAYGTVCRLPGFHTSDRPNPEAYAEAVISGQLSDPTLTPLIKMGLTYQGTIENYMEDDESGNAGAILEWTP